MLLHLEINIWQSLGKAAILLAASFEIAKEDVFSSFMYFCIRKIDIVWATSSSHFLCTYYLYLTQKKKKKEFPLEKVTQSSFASLDVSKLKCMSALDNELQTQKLHKAQLVIRWQIVSRISVSLFHLPLSHQLQWMKSIHVETQLV